MGGDHERIVFAAALTAAVTVAAAGVGTRSGQISGVRIDDEITVYKGIPYAAAPVGGLRWKAPLPVVPWKDVRAATQFGPACVQPKSTSVNVYTDDPPRMSEDCLYLNIWQPAKVKSGAPVMVWIHGGAFRSGHTSSAVYDGAELARRGVVIVSISYRMGILGFLAHPELSAESPQHVSGTKAIAESGYMVANYSADQGTAMTLDLTGRVAVVTGAGGGLGREHALLLARRGAKVVVNDLGGSVAGVGASATAAEAVVEEIRAAGGEAMANAASVTDFAAVTDMIEQPRSRWGKVDILVNNAGVLRDKTFAKMTLEDFRSVIDVHLMGSVHCTKAVWNYMRDQNYGRIVLTTSSSGLYGNFGQANYGAAKLALVGLMQTLGLEGAKYNIRVNCLAPSAGTRMLDGLMSDEMSKTLSPGSVSPGVIALVAADAPNRMILCAGGGSYERAYITITRGIYVGVDDQAAETIAQNWEAVGDRTTETIPEGGMQQSQLEFEKARLAGIVSDPV